MNDMYGPNRLRRDLEALGFKVTEIPGSDGQTYEVMLGFEIQSGQFAGRIIDLGIQALPNYPQGVPAAIQVRAKPHLFDLADTLSGIRNIKESPLGSDWRYWSKNFAWECEKTTRRLISQINKIFEDA